MNGTMHKLLAHLEGAIEDELHFDAHYLMGELNRERKRAGLEIDWNAYPVAREYVAQLGEQDQMLRRA